MSRTSSLTMPRGAFATSSSTPGTGGPGSMCWCHPMRCGRSIGRNTRSNSTFLVSSSTVITSGVDTAGNGEIRWQDQACAEDADQGDSPSRLAEITQFQLGDGG